MGRAVLMIDDEATLGKNVTVYLSRRGFDARWAQSGEEGLALIDAFKPDLVLLDLQMGGIGGLETLRRLKASAPKTRVIIMTGHGDVRTAVEAMQAGAANFLQKPVALAELEIIIERTLEEERLEGELAYHRGRQASGAGLAKMIGRSAPIEEMREKIRHFVASEERISGGPPPTVLITGETGTGKEVVARAFHFEGPRRAKPFIEINCAALPAHLIESELLGFERGAFTDAKERKLGLVEAAHTGTLFLDEIGELDLKVQSKLLKLIEDRSVRRVGGLRDTQVDVRIIAATNQDLEARVRAGEFRSDLYFRLRVIQIQLPPLRQRGEDVALLAEEFLRVHAKRYGKGAMQFSPAALAALRRHSWPGNVRELHNTIEAAVLMSGDSVIEPAHLLIGPAAAAVATAPSGGASGSIAAEALDRGMTLEALEEELVTEALHRTGENVSQAARLLGISRDALRYRLDKRRPAAS